jgi:maltooligosyltrehalose trehalohydrolase
VFGDDGVVIPDPEKPSTFEASKLNWEELNLPERADMLGWYRALIKLRRRTPDLNDGTRGHAQASYDEDAKWFSMTRGNIRVVCNLATKEQQFPIATGSEVLLSSRPVIAHKGDAIVMAPRSTAVIAEPV